MKIYFLIATQHDNMGDLLINKMLIDELSTFAEVYVDSAGLPNEFKKYIYSEKIKDFEKEYFGSLKRISGIKLLPKVKKDFQFYFKSPGPSGGERINLKNILRKVALSFQYFYLSKAGVKMNLIGNDVNLMTFLDVFFEKLSNPCFDNYMLRSKENVQFLKEKKFKNVSFIPDVAFLYNPIEILNLKKEKVFISFRDLKSESNTDKIILILENLVPHFLEKGLQIVFFHQVSSDKEFNLMLFNKFNKSGVFLNEKCMSYDEIYLYNKAKYVVTNRLHVTILGIVHETVPLVLLNNSEKTNKINRILRDNDLEDLLVGNFDQILGVIDRYEFFRKKINTVSKDNKLKIKKGLDIVFNEKDI